MGGLPAPPKNMGWNILGQRMAKHPSTIEQTMMDLLVLSSDVLVIVISCVELFSGKNQYLGFPPSSHAHAPLNRSERNKVRRAREREQISVILRVKNIIHTFASDRSKQDS